MRAVLSIPIRPIAMGTLVCHSLQRNGYISLPIGIVVIVCLHFLWWNRCPGGAVGVRWSEAG